MNAASAPPLGVIWSMNARPGPPRTARSRGTVPIPFVTGLPATLVTELDRRSFWLSLPSHVTGRELWTKGGVAAARARGACPEMKKGAAVVRDGVVLPP